MRSGFVRRKFIVVWGWLEDKYWLVITLFIYMRDYRLQVTCRDDLKRFLGRQNYFKNLLYKLN